MSEIKSGKERQAKFKEEQRQMGLVQKTVWVDKESYEKGKLDAETALRTGESLLDFLPKILQEQFYTMDAYCLGFATICK